jgi:hypothetical protein
VPEVTGGKVNMKKSNNIISDWLDKYGDPEIDKKVEKELERITNKNMSEKTGHRDINGVWVDETPQAKLRNKLTPFWTLSSIISDEKFDKTNDDVVDIINRLANTCETLKDEIMSLIAETER